MKRKIEITYEWWINEGENEIPNEIQERLETEAENRIYEMRKEFYTGGELIFEAEDGTTYNGYWNYTEINNPE